MSPAPEQPQQPGPRLPTDAAGISAYQSVGYKLDGIEGYIFAKTASVPGTVKLLRRYNPARDDHAIFPENQLAAMQAEGYTELSGSDWLGYVYPNVDSDGDGLIDGFETILGTQCLRGRFRSESSAGRNGVPSGRSAGVRSLNPNSWNSNSLTPWNCQTFRPLLKPPPESQKRPASPPANCRRCHGADTGVSTENASNSPSPSQGSDDGVKKSWA